MLRDRQQITFVTLKRFCPLSRKPASSFISCSFTSAFTSADIIFYNFLELNSKLSKKDFRHKFSFFNSFTQIPHPLNSQNLLSMIKVFCRCCLTGKSSICNSEDWNCVYHIRNKNQPETESSIIRNTRNWKQSKIDLDKLQWMWAVGPATVIRDK